MTDPLSVDSTLATLRALLANGQITQAQFDACSAPLVAHNAGSGAIAQGAAAQAVAARGVAIGGDSSAPIDISNHFHIGAPGQAASTSALRQTYLGRLWRQSNAVSLLDGGENRGNVRLAAVYTALLTARPKDESKGAEGRQGAFRGPDEMDAAMDRTMRDRMSAVAVLDADPRLVLLGGPGSGKSTFVSFVAQAMAGELLVGQAQATHSNLATLTAPLPADEHAREEKDKPPAPQPWRHGALLPVVVVLRDLAAQLPPPGQAAGAQTVWSYVCKMLEAASLAEFAPALKAEMQEQGALVMFDGLDEVPDAPQRREQIKQAVTDFAATFGKCRILVTSRTYAYQEQAWKLPGFTETTLSPFSLGQIRRFVQAWYAHMVELDRLTDEDAKGRAVVLLLQVERNPRVRELAVRPLLLTLFARLQTEKGGSLPERREALYHAAVDMLLNDWERLKVRRNADGSTAEVEPSLSEWLNASQQAIRDQLNRLAFEAHRGQKELKGTADIRQADLVQALLRASPKQDDIKVLRLQGYLRDRAGILAAHGEEMLQFPHRSFQEYLAACHLANDEFPDQLAALLRAEPLRWREVTLLAAAHAASGNKSLPTWALAEALCPEEAGAAPFSAPDAWGALLAGQVLVAAGEHQAPVPRNRSKHSRVRDWQLALLTRSDLPAAERALAGRNLAALGDTRPEVMTLDGMQFCVVPPGPFLMGERGDQSDREGPQHEVDVSYPYLMARFPVTVAQWREFVESTGYADYDAASLRGRPNDPVTDVSQGDAVHFCAALTRRWRAQLPKGWEVCLPSEAEWEKAARGGTQLPAQTPSWLVPRQGFEVQRVIPPIAVANPFAARKYPWGDTFIADCANAASAVGEVSAVGCFPLGASPYGCEDLSGNVWEWTRSLWGPEWGEPKFKYPYDTRDHLREDLNAGDEESRVVRGGAFLSSSDYARCAFRYGDRPGLRNDDLGFRVVLRSSPVPGLWSRLLRSL